MVSIQQIQKEAEELLLAFNNGVINAAEVTNSTLFTNSNPSDNYSETLLSYKLLRWKYLNSGRLYIQVGGWTKPLNYYQYVINQTAIAEYAASFDNFDIFVFLKLKFYRGIFADDLRVEKVDFHITKRGESTCDEKINGRKITKFDKHPQIKNVFYCGKIII